MAELNSKPFSAESGFLSRVFKGAPAYYAKPDLQQYFDSLEHNLAKHNKLVLGDATGSVVILPDSSWNLGKTIYNLHLGVTDPFTLEIGKFKVPFVGNSLDHVDSLIFSGTTLAQPMESGTPPTILEKQITNILLLARQRTVKFSDDSAKGGISGPGIPIPLESSDVVEYYDFSLGIFKGLDIPETVDSKLVVCVVAQFTFYFDDFWKPLLIQNFRTSRTNMDISGRNRFPVLNKVLSSFGQFDWINKVMDALNSLALRVDGSNHAITDLYVDKGSTGRFKIITREDYASTTQAGIVRISTDVESSDPDNNSTALTPHGLFLALGSTRKIYEIGIWDMMSTDLVSFPHNLGSSWVKAIPAACSIINDSRDAIFTFFDASNSQLFIDNTYITLHRIGDTFNNVAYSSVSVLNRGYVILDLVGVSQPNPLIPPVVNSGPDISLELIPLTYRTPVLRSLTKSGDSDNPTQLGTLSSTIEMGEGTEGYPVELQYRRHGSLGAWVTMATDSNLGQPFRTIGSTYITDTGIPPSLDGLYNIRLRVFTGTLELFSNVISVDLTKAMGTVWGDGSTGIIDFDTQDAVNRGDNLGFFVSGIYKGVTFETSRLTLFEVDISTDKEVLCQNYVDAINADYSDLLAVRLGKIAYVSVKEGSSTPIVSISVFKNVQGGFPVQGTYAKATTIPQINLVTTENSASYVETTVTGAINSFVGSLTNRGWSVVSGPMGSVTQLSATGTNQATFRFSSVGTWVLRFFATSSDGTGTTTGSDLCTVIVTSTVVVTPVVSLRHSDNTTALKIYPITGTGNILLIGSVTTLPTANINSWEFEYRSSVDSNNVLLPSFSPWSSLGFNVVPGNPNQANFFVNRPYGTIQFRGRVKDSSGIWTNYSTVLEGSVSFTATAPLIENYGLLTNVGTGNPDTTGNHLVSDVLKFRVRGVVTNPRFNLWELSRTTFVEYDPFNVQALPADITHYERTSLVTISGVFDCTTPSGVSTLGQAICNFINSNLNSGNGGGLGASIYNDFNFNFYEYFTGTTLSDGAIVTLGFLTSRGTLQANESLYTSNPPRLAKRVYVQKQLTVVDWS